METFTIKNLTFSYPEQEKKIIKNLTLSVEEGDFLVLCGASGCGKSTLLRQLKSVLAPHGNKSGEIYFENQLLETMDQREQSSKIGFVLQSPDNQIVTDKVWHELAFGLESLGFDTPTIRQRVAEMASFFGIQNWFYKNVTDLSGGQKQLLNLAAVMAMHPRVLILDEPTSQLDPIAAADFLATLGKINRELGTTIILTEHRLEDAFHLANKVVVMDKGGLIAQGAPKDVGVALKNLGHSMFLAMPTPMRIWAAVENNSETPITVRDGRKWIEDFAKQKTIGKIPNESQYKYEDKVMVNAKDIWFKYDKNLPDIVKGVDLTMKKGEFLALLGGNGTGKSTTMKLLANLQQPYRGSVELFGRVGVLPQNPQTLFVKKTVREDLFEIFAGKKISQAIKNENVAYVTRLCRLEDLLDRHPYDLSGGEQQRAALAKVLLLAPEVLLLDEPTKGLEAEFKTVFGEIMLSLVAKGVTILMISHDLEFCARYAHKCALFFDGNIVSIGSPRKFFSGNSFYTTSANRMARVLLPEAVTPEDVISACGGTLPPKVELPKDKSPLPEPKENSADFKPKPLPWWRKFIAGISLVGIVYSFIEAMKATNLNELVNINGVTDSGIEYMSSYVILISCLVLFGVAIGRRSPKPIDLQVKCNKRKLDKRTLAAAIMILLTIPLTLFIGETYLDSKKYYFIALLIMMQCMLPFFLIFEGRKPQARELVIIAVLCAIAVAGRVIFFMMPQFKPVIALVIIAGISLGAETGFLVGAMSMLASNMVFGQGPWTPMQMFSAGVIGFLAGILFKKGLLRRSRESMAIFGAFATIIVYGGIMDASFIMLGSDNVNFKMLIVMYVTGFAMNLIHAIATAIFLWFGGEAFLEKLDRIKVKYGIVQ